MYADLFHLTNRKIAILTLGNCSFLRSGIYTWIPKFRHPFLESINPKTFIVFPKKYWHEWVCERIVNQHELEVKSTYLTKLRPTPDLAIMVICISWVGFLDRFSSPLSAITTWGLRDSLTRVQSLSSNFA